MPLVPGAIAERFGVEALLGEGASASVYRVRDRRRGGLLVLKVLRLAGRDARARFAQEAALWEGIRHRNVVGVVGAIARGAPLQRQAEVLG